MDKITKKEINNKTFDDIKHIDENGNEYWYARELQIVLEYTEWRNFHKAIDKAILSIETDGGDKNDWLVEVNKPIITGKGKEETIKDYKLSRYICYFIVLNGDVSKKIIATAQKYFVIRTRRDELNEQEYNSFSEDEKRFNIRNQTKKGNYTLQQLVKDAGVKNFDKFHNAGYKGLYNETADEIFKRKGLRYRKDILDNMGSEELANNLFRIVQTESKLKNEKTQGESNVNKAHNKIGKIVRSAIKKSGGTMPEQLPTLKKSLKELTKESKKNLPKK